METQLVHDLRSLIESKGLKLFWVAEQVGVSVVTLRSWCRGDTRPDIAQANKLAQVLGVTLEEISACFAKRPTAQPEATDPIPVPQPAQ